jgi:hypothetical protein
LKLKFGYARYVLKSVLDNAREDFYYSAILAWMAYMISDPHSDIKNCKKEQREKDGQY